MTFNLPPLFNLFLYSLAQSLCNETKEKVKLLLFCKDPLCCDPSAYVQAIVQNGSFIEITCVPHAATWIFYVDVRIVRDLMFHFRPDFQVPREHLKGFFLDPFHPKGPLEKLMLVESVTPFVNEFQCHLENMWKERESGNQQQIQGAQVAEGEIAAAMKILLPELTSKAAC